MSIWTKPIFGTKARASTPASPVATRCARMLAAAGIEVAPLIFVGLLSGKALYFVAISMIAMAALAPPQIAWVERLSAFMSGFEVGHLLVTFGMLAFVLFVLPRVARWLLRRKNSVPTLEARHKQRRMRRLAKKLDGAAFWILGALGVLGFVAGMGGMPLRISPVLVGTGLASWGLAMALMALRGRTGAKLVCGRCDYPMATWRGAPERCPECGQHWKDPWNARIGARRVNRRLLALGATSMTIAIVMLAVVRVMLAR